MTTEELQRLDGRLFAVHSLLTILMRKHAGDPLLENEVKAIASAEKTINAAREQVVTMSSPTTRPSIPFTTAPTYPQDDAWNGGYRYDQTHY